MNDLTINKSYLATNLSFTDDKMVVYLEDGRELAIPLEWFPKLRNATMEQLKKWRFIGEGEGIHWDELDEDVSVENLFKDNEKRSYRYEDSKEAEKIVIMV